MPTCPVCNKDDKYMMLEPDKDQWTDTAASELVRARQERQEHGYCLAWCTCGTIWNYLVSETDDSFTKSIWELKR